MELNDILYNLDENTKQYVKAYSVMIIHIARALNIDYNVCRGLGVQIMLHVYIACKMVRGGETQGCRCVLIFVL